MFARPPAKQSMQIDGATVVKKMKMKMKMKDFGLKIHDKGPKAIKKTKFLGVVDNSLSWKKHIKAPLKFREPLAF